MTTSLVRADERGLHVRTGGYVFRPGAIRAYSHALRMDDGGLAAGDRVKARHKGGTPLARLTLPDGATTYWCEEQAAATDRVDAPPEATWRPDGGRVTEPGSVTDVEEGTPRAITAIHGLDVDRAPRTASGRAGDA